MKIVYAAAALILATFSVSCIAPVRPGVLGAGYSDRDAYQLGFSDGARDNHSGRAYKPHINEPERVPSAHRNDYLWGYVEGFRDSYRYRPSGSK